MKCASITFAIVALGTGLLAAFYWYKSSRITIGPTGPDWGLPGTGAHIEPVIPEAKALDMSVANMRDNQAVIDAIKIAAALNKVAALWTAASVTASAVSAILGATA